LVPKASFIGGGLSATLESKDHRRNHLPKAQSTAKGHSGCRRLSNAPRIAKAVVLEGTSRVDDRPYQHRVMWNVTRLPRATAFVNEWSSRMAFIMVY